MRLAILSTGCGLVSVFALLAACGSDAVVNDVPGADAAVDTGRVPDPPKASGVTATPERLAHFARYDAARRANNRTAAKEERRYRRHRKALAEQDKRFRHGEDEEAGA